VNAVKPLLLRISSAILKVIPDQKKVIEGFSEYNDEIQVLILKGEYSKGTLTRFKTALSHVPEFMLHKYKSRI